MTLAHKFGKLDVRVTDDFANKESDTIKGGHAKAKEKTTSERD